MNPMEKHLKNEQNIRKHDIFYFKKKLCRHNKLHPLTARIVKWISETTYRDIEKIIQHDSQKYITSEGGEDLSNKKFTNFDIDYDLFRCSDCTKSLCLYIKRG